jgi:phosphoglycerate dehydrogenase-like enzyme
MAAASEGAYLQVLRDAGLEVDFPRKRVTLSEDELLAELPGVSATLAGTEPYTARVLASAPELRVIARTGVGFDAIDLAASTGRGVAVTVTPGANQDAVAEHTLALLLALAKRLLVQHGETVAGGWRRQAALPLRGRALGIAGLGRIGKAVAVRADAFGMRVLAYEPFPDRGFVERYRVALVPLERLLAESDYVTLHVPLTAESRHLINRRTLSLMKPTAFLINTSRGGLVCEADLVEALRGRHIAGAGLDVFEQEPPGGSPLFALDNVVCTPHTAGVDERSRDDMAAQAARTVAALSRGEWPAAEVVNPDVRPRFRW